MFLCDVNSTQNHGTIFAILNQMNKHAAFDTNVCDAIIVHMLQPSHLCM